MDQTFNEFDGLDSLKSQVKKLQDFITKLSGVSSGNGAYESEVNKAYQLRKQAERQLAEKLIILEKLNPKTAMDYLMEYRYVPPDVVSLPGVKHVISQNKSIVLSVLYYASIVVMMVILPIIVIYLNYNQIYLF
jgi:hypothetical protein